MRVRGLAEEESPHRVHDLRHRLVVDEGEVSEVTITPRPHNLMSVWISYTLD